MKVKMITGSMEDEFEDKINKFLTSNDVMVRDITYSTEIVTSVGTYPFYTAMIMYTLFAVDSYANIEGRKIDD